jgi:uncharacterized protein (TIGR02646 family)
VIRIVKPRTPPAILRTHGRTAARQHCEAYDRGDAVKIRVGIYRHPSVKAALRKAQHDKCAFCESRFSHVGYGDVEHFRPKAGYKQRAADSLTTPGYYWLAYDWNNLFLSCQLCNQRFKRNLFPLDDPGSRALSHHQRRRLSSEQALLLDPAKDDPSRFLTFDAASARAVGGNRRGRTTIEVFGLNRTELIEMRGDRLDVALEMAALRGVLLDLPAEQRSPELTARLERLNARLHSFQADTAEYAAMMRAALADA